MSEYGKGSFLRAIFLIAEGSEQAFMCLMKVEPVRRGAALTQTLPGVSKGLPPAATRQVEGLLCDILMPPQPSTILRTGCRCLVGNRFEKDEAALSG